MFSGALASKAISNLKTPLSHVFSGVLFDTGVVKMRNRAITQVKFRQDEGRIVLSGMSKSDRGTGYLVEEIIIDSEGKDPAVLREEVKAAVQKMLGPQSEKS